MPDLNSFWIFLFLFHLFLCPQWYNRLPVQTTLTSQRWSSALLIDTFILYLVLSWSKALWGRLPSANKQLKYLLRNTSNAEKLFSSLFFSTWVTFYNISIWYYLVNVTISSYSSGTAPLTGVLLSLPTIWFLTQVPTEDGLSQRAEWHVWWPIQCWTWPSPPAPEQVISFLCIYLLPCAFVRSRWFYLIK